jgi:hypothetical protein
MVNQPTESSKGSVLTVIMELGISRRSGSELCLLHLTAPFTFGVERRRPDRDIEQDTLFAYCAVPLSAPPPPWGGGELVRKCSNTVYVGTVAGLASSP